MGVFVDVDVAVGVSVSLGVSVGVGVYVAVSVFVDVAVRVSVSVGMLAGVSVGVGLGVRTVKLAMLVAVPPGLVTMIVPLVAPSGTLALMDVAERMLKLALLPLNCTLLVRAKSYPLMVTLVPAAPLAGEKAVMDGGTALTAAPASSMPAPQRFR